MTAVGVRSPERTTIRLDIIAALRSGSSSMRLRLGQFTDRRLDESGHAPDQRTAGRDDGLGCLAPEHERRDLGGVGLQMGKARFEDLDPGDGEATLKLDLEAPVDLVRVAAERERLLGGRRESS